MKTLLLLTILSISIQAEDCLTKKCIDKKMKTNKELTYNQAFEACTGVEL